MIVSAGVSSTVEKDTPIEFEDCLTRYFAESLIEDFACPVCNERTTCSKQVRLVTYPTTLAVVLAREVIDEDSWVPKKIEVDLKMT
jgi:ubiquitin C-terminal hydrolase